MNSAVIEEPEEIPQPTLGDVGRKFTIDNFDYRSLVHDETMENRNLVIDIISIHTFVKAYRFWFISLILFLYLT